MGKSCYNAKTLKTPDLDPNTVYVFTDGSSSNLGNHWVGAWAAVLLFRGHKLEIAGAVDGGTIGRMELMAMEQGLLAVKRRNVSIQVVSDSTYAVETMARHYKGHVARGWLTTGGKPVAHADLIERMIPLRENVAFRWVKGHSTNTWNHLADRLATEARKAMQAELGLLSAAGLEQSKKARDVEKLDCEGNVVIDGNGRVIIRNARGIEKLNLDSKRARAMAYAILERTEDPQGAGVGARMYGPRLAQEIEASREVSAKLTSPPSPPPPRPRIRTRTVGAA